MTQTSNIETNRLVLRPFSESDAPDVFESCKNPNLGNKRRMETSRNDRGDNRCSKCHFYRERRGLGYRIKRDKTSHWLHWHHSRSKAGESACPHAGILAG